MERNQEGHGQRHPVYLFITGIVMGSADIVPGVSGGTMALIMGVYEQLLSAIRSFDSLFLRTLFSRRYITALRRIPWSFLVPLGSGILLALFTLAEMLTYLLNQHPVLLFSFFFGLIIGSVVVLCLRQSWNGVTIIAFVLGAGLAFWIVGLVPADPGHAPVTLFGSGALAICAMILPGISGSFILLILGQYKFCVETLTAWIDAVSNQQWTQAATILANTITPLILGMVVGLAVFSRLLGWLLRHYHAVTLATLIGFMVGSLRRIWPYKQYLEWTTDSHGDKVPLSWFNRWPIAEEPFLEAIVCAAIGFVLIVAIEWYAILRLRRERDSLSN